MRDERVSRLRAYGLVTALVLAIVMLVAFGLPARAATVGDQCAADESATLICVDGQLQEAPVQCVTDQPPLGCVDGHLVATTTTTPTSTTVGTPCESGPDCGPTNEQVEAELIPPLVIEADTMEVAVVVDIEVPESRIAYWFLPASARVSG
jgi:hypothetical protein